MVGFILAMLYVGFTMAVNGVAFEVALSAVLPFLWYWHLTFACVFGGIVVLIFLASFCATVFGKEVETKGIGLTGMLVGTPLLLILGAIGCALFLGGVYCMGESITIDQETGEVAAFALWNIPLFIVGCILYGVGLLRQVAARASATKGS